jgi:hypothetical protein
MLVYQRVDSNRLRSGIGASLWPRWVPCHWLLLRYLGRSILDMELERSQEKRRKIPKKSSDTIYYYHYLEYYIQPPDILYYGKSQTAECRKYPATWYHLIPSDTYSTPSMWRMCSALTNRRWRFLRRHVNTSQQRWSSAGSSEGFQSCAKKGVKQWFWC